MERSQELIRSRERREEEENRGRARTPRGGGPPTSCRAVPQGAGLTEDALPKDEAGGRDGPRSGGAGAVGGRLARRRSAI